MLNIMIPQDSALERYLRQRYRVDEWEGYRSGVPAIDERAVQIEGEVRELEKQMRIPQKKLDYLYFNWRPTQAGRNAINEVVHARCESCKHYYANIPRQCGLAELATQMVQEKDGLTKEIASLLKGNAKPCPQGLWDVFVVDKEKDQYELVVGDRFVGPEICPDFREVETKTRKVKSNG